jgi:hypothetical protein
MNLIIQELAIVMTWIYLLDNFSLPFESPRYSGQAFTSLLKF